MNDKDTKNWSPEARYLKQDRDDLLAGAMGEGPLIAHHAGKAFLEYLETDEMMEAFDRIMRMKNTDVREPEHWRELAALLMPYLKASKKEVKQ